MKKNGFSLIELMIVVAIITFLAMIAMPSFSRFLAKAKRAEAYVNLSAIYAAEKAYWAEHGTYTTALNGEDSIGWQPEGYSGGGKKEKFYYTYGSAQGAEGKNHFTGKLETSPSNLHAAKADKNGFLIAAAADIMGNGKIDILTVDQFNNITVLQDGLA
jgi:prepilin-type N-terminal cleavage/methylation domain-containing protein